MMFILCKQGHQGLKQVFCTQPTTCKQPFFKQKQLFFKSRPWSYCQKLDRKSEQAANNNATTSKQK